MKRNSKTKKNHGITKNEVFWVLFCAIVFISGWGISYFFGCSPREQGIFGSLGALIAFLCLAIGIWRMMKKEKL